MATTAARYGDTLPLPRNPLMDKLIQASANHRASKRQRRTCHQPDTDHDNMAFFAPSTTQHLAPPRSLARKRSQLQLASRNDVDEYLSSSDLELSFASNVSLSSPQNRSSGLPDCEPMDISPMPPAKTSSRTSATLSFKPTSRARSGTTTSARLFGSDLSNGPNSKPSEASTTKTSGSTTANKKLTRSALPTEWFTAMRPAEPEVPQAPTQPSSPTTDDAMDVDTSYMVDSAQAISQIDSSPIAQPAAPKPNGISNLFFDTLSPRRSFESPAGPPRKRRSLSPERTRDMIEDASSSPGMPLPPSPSESKLDRMAAAGRNVKPSLQGLGAPSASFARRPRRPVLSELIHPSGQEIQSAYPILSPSAIQEESPAIVSAPPVRRAFSALLPPTVFTAPESDSSFDAEGPDMSSPAQAYAKRQQFKTIRRCDGTEDFRPLTGATAMVLNESPATRLMKAPGLPGFGDNERHGKILPCHPVPEDGLMRIKPETLNNLLDGKYEGAIHDFHIIDCRFDYEYKGGHIAGAVNINTTSGVEELLLGPSLTKPRPSVSGDSMKKTVLIFHCEFSAKRAPTFAKHLRARDRAMNNHNYPKIHYPEVYVLEGGYCHYFKVSSKRCDPPAYVTMDDPNHASSRREDLDQFRKTKFGRHKSYAYGDGTLKPALLPQQVQSKRNTAPTTLFAAASAARTRRAVSVSLTTLAEDANTTAEAEHEDTDTDLGDSPCPPPTKATTLKTKKPLGRLLVRAETYNPSRY
ncbi:hypothetical protein H1R20_g11875, partial [Candolleomyces eurysporus]